MNFETVEHKQFPGTWNTEATSVDGENIYVASFSGPLAKERATEYRDYMNSQVKGVVQL